jgi:hypothetical protein
MYQVLMANGEKIRSSQKRSYLLKNSTFDDFIRILITSSEHFSLISFTLMTKYEMCRVYKALRFGVGSEISFG